MKIILPLKTLYLPWKNWTSFGKLVFLWKNLHNFFYSFSRNSLLDTKNPDTLSHTTNHPRPRDPPLIKYHYPSMNKKFYRSNSVAKVRSISIDTRDVKTVVWGCNISGGEGSIESSKEIFLPPVNYREFSLFCIGNIGSAVIFSGQRVRVPNSCVRLSQNR